jgi:hypothetical protein
MRKKYLQKARLAKVRSKYTPPLSFRDTNTNLNTNILLEVYSEKPVSGTNK